MKYQPTIGLEIHIELDTKSKMFCSCKNDSEEKHPNVNICPICLGHPGTLPVINEEAVIKTIKTGIALNCLIAEYSKFDRKNYFYPDLPKGYQISQYDMPICEKGYLRIGERKIRIRRIHLEEDTGKLIHKDDYSLVDFNRAGVPLMELVTEPDIISAKEARVFAQELQLILRYLKVSEADMEKGQLRVEANVSVTPFDSNPDEINKKLGVKVEIKNLNSFKSVERAIEYEIARQIRILESRKKVLQETRGWDEVKQKTFSQREKEEAHDYRYFPEPDLPPLYFNKELIDEIKSQIPELPQDKRERFKKEYHLLDKEIDSFVFNKSLGEYYEKVISELRNWVKDFSHKEEVKDEDFFYLAKLCSNYLLTDLQFLLKKSFVEGEDFLITPENFAELITLIYRKKISSKIAKEILKEMFSKGVDPSHVIKEKGLLQITNESELRKVILEVVSQNKKAIEDFKKGKNSAIQFLIGKTMGLTKGKANPQIVEKILRETLDKKE